MIDVEYYRKLFEEKRPMSMADVARLLSISRQAATVKIHSHPGLWAVWKNYRGRKLKSIIKARSKRMAAAGAAGKGFVKRRGDSEYYRSLSMKARERRDNPAPVEDNQAVG
jgi:hypothetical protein